MPRLSRTLNSPHNDQQTCAVRPVFQTFQVTPANQFAHSASVAVADYYVGESYNPLIIVGDAGCGKTHLLLAIQEYAREKRKIVFTYVSGKRLAKRGIPKVSQRLDSFSLECWLRKDERGVLVDGLAEETLREPWFLELRHKLQNFIREGRQVVLAVTGSPESAKILLAALGLCGGHALFASIKPGTQR